MSDEAEHTECDLFSVLSRPFTRFYSEKELIARPYEDFLPSWSAAFAGSAGDVEVSQRPKRADAWAPAMFLHNLEVVTTEGFSSSWLSLEIDVSAALMRHPSEIYVQGSGSALYPGPIEGMVRHLENITAKAEFTLLSQGGLSILPSSFSLTTSLPRLPKCGNYKLILFLPSVSLQVIELEHLVGWSYSY